MARPLRYTTFAAGELESHLRQMLPEGATLPSEALLQGQNGGNMAGGGIGLKTYTCSVRYADGQEGSCRYTRIAPRWHTFHFAYEDTSLPSQSWSQTLGNEAVSIQAKAQELAEAAYRDAVARERKEYFQRGTESADGSRKRRPALYQMKAAQAKYLAGKYAVCQRLPTTLMVMGPIRERLEDANADWKAHNNPRLVVGCCSRLDRCWLIPRFNPLYGECDMRGPYSPPLAFASGSDSRLLKASNPESSCANPADTPVCVEPEGCQAEEDGDEDDLPDDATYHEENEEENDAGEWDDDGDWQDEEEQEEPDL